MGFFVFFVVVVLLLLFLFFFWGGGGVEHFNSEITGSVLDYPTPHKCLFLSPPAYLLNIMVSTTQTQSNRRNLLATYKNTLSQALSQMSPMAFKIL